MRTPAGISLPGGACLPPACLLGCLHVVTPQLASMCGLLLSHMPITLCPAALPLLAAVKVAGKAMEVNMTRLGPLVLPWSGAQRGMGPGGPCVLALPVLYKTAGRLVTAAAVASCCLQHQMARANASAGALVPANCRLLPAEKLAFAANWVARNVLR